MCSYMWEKSQQENDKIIMQTSLEKTKPQPKNFNENVVESFETKR